MRSTLRLLAGLAFLTAATTLFAAPAEISGIDKIYLREGPGSEQPAIGVLSGGDPVEILDIEGSWTKIQTPDGKVGYVYHRYVQPRFGEPAAPAVPPTSPPTPPPSSAFYSPRPAVISPPQPTAVHRPPTAAPPQATVAARPPTPAPQATVAAAPAPVPELSAELAVLRAELADLKQKIQEQQIELSGEQAIPHGTVSPAGSRDPSALGGALAADPPPPSPSALSARDQGIGILMIALFSLVVGWVLGSAFGRRGGPRSGRGGRLRF